MIPHTYVLPNLTNFLHRSNFIGVNLQTRGVSGPDFLSEKSAMYLETSPPPILGTLQFIRYSSYRSVARGLAPPSPKKKRALKLRYSW